jgi:hypothetical protein
MEHIEQLPNVLNDSSIATYLKSEVIGKHKGSSICHVLKLTITDPDGSQRVVEVGLEEKDIYTLKGNLKEAILNSQVAAQEAMGGMSVTLTEADEEDGGLTDGTFLSF